MTRSRRDFLKSMVGTASLLSLAPTIPAFLQQRGCRGADATPVIETPSWSFCNCPAAMTVSTRSCRTPTMPTDAVETPCG